ncbi:MAG: DUF481 domain-containing protein [Alphaproteobacteria bacterium]|jgi:putative salt-induced outer membrane protein|nr:DUF481 domain-containing protein [Alphaproteobacteria bacterium]
MKHVLSVCAACAMSVVPAAAQDAQWLGEGSLSAGYTTGNTETTDLGLGLDLARETQVWKTSLEAVADFGETDGVETRNRWFLAGQLDRQINDRLYGFVRASHERDQFSGFDSRSFLGGGLGYEILAGEPTSWSVEAGPGLKIDEVKRRVTTDEDGNARIVSATTQESFSVVGASNFAHEFNENVGFTNETSLLYAEESTQLGNIAAVTADLTDALSARVSFEVRHDTDPPANFEATDTATRVSLVYTFQ